MVLPPKFPWLILAEEEETSSAVMMRKIYEYDHETPAPPPPPPPPRGFFLQSINCMQKHMALSCQKPLAD